MRKMDELRGVELKWVQPKAFKQEYELQAGGEIAATLRFRGSFRSFATAQAADGVWTFKRAGFSRTRVLIRIVGSKTDLAVFKYNMWKRGGTLEIPGGRRYRADSNFWMTRYAFHDESSEDLVRYGRIGGVLHRSSIVEIDPAAVKRPELPWLVILGWYLVVMMHRDAASRTRAAS
jgi:hypothetical protein